MTFLSQLCLGETTVNWHVTGDRDIFNSIRIAWSVPKVAVFQHRRDKGDRKEVSIQADFAFLNTTGEIVADELPGSVKILVLTEMMSRCIGYVVVGEDVEAARRQIAVWLQHFGLTSKAVSIDVHTDSERAVGEIIGNSTGRYTFSIRRAAPQQHRSVGAAERSVRELKESFFCAAS